MSLTRTLAEKLASALTATSLSGLSMLLRNSAGALVAYNPYNPSLTVTDLDSATIPGTYVYGSGAGMLVPGQGLDFDYGILEVFVRYGATLQRITSTSLRMAIRKFANGAWSDWEIIH